MEKKKKPTKESVKSFIFNKKTLIIIGAIILLVVVSFLSFVFQFKGPIRSPEDVSEAVTGIGSAIEDIGSILEDIDKSLG